MHKSVLLNETLEFLKCENKQAVLDCTVGGGGHAQEILKNLPPGGRLIGIDADEKALEIAKENLKNFKGAFVPVKENFRNFDKVLNDLGIDSVDAMLFDLGISSFQLEDGERGFSFSNKGPLDMRMDRGLGEPLWQKLNRLSEDELGRIIRDFGEERYWRRIARALMEEKRISPIKDTFRLADIVRRSIRYRSGTRTDQATRTFQAFRIFINDELGALREALGKAGGFLKKDGRIVVISFHSLEDRIAKQTFKDLALQGAISILTKKPITPSEGERIENPRSRSAKLRAAQRL